MALARKAGLLGLHRLAAEESKPSYLQLDLEEAAEVEGVAQLLVQHFRMRAAQEELFLAPRAGCARRSRVWGAEPVQAGKCRQKRESTIVSAPPEREARRA